MAEVVLLPDRVPSLGRAVEQFLAAKPLSPNARRSYAYCLGAVVEDLGAGTALADVTPERLRGVLEQRWGNAAAATWNNRLAAVGSFRRWVQAQGWIRDDPLAGIEHRPQVRDDTTPIRYEQLHALWTREDVHVREKTLWRMLYETAARANEVLALNIKDLDVGARRAVVRGKGGHRQEVVWASGTARLLPRYLGGRQRGPLFVTHRRPNQAGARAPRCVSRHGAGKVVVSAGVGAVPQHVGLDAAPAAPLRPHPSRREESRGTAVESQEPPPEPAQPRPVCTAGHRSGSRPHCRA